MGWLSLVVIYQMVIKLAPGSVTLLAVGGVIYSLGVIFYVCKRDPIQPRNLARFCSVFATSSRFISIFINYPSPHVQGDGGLYFTHLLMNKAVAR